MAQLTTQRASAATRQSVPAIVDENAWNTLHLSQGASFSIHFAADSYDNQVHFTVIAKVQHIPTGVNSTLPGIMVDFFSYTTVYTHTNVQFIFIVPLNYVWLRTRNDAASPASTFYGIQSIPPIQMVVPTSLVTALALLIITCIGALAMMIRIVSRPSISQLLRLNED